MKHLKMNYLVCKKGGREEYRIYIDGQEVEGTEIYKGHKLGVESNPLLEILDFRIEKSSSKIHFLNYDKVEESVSVQNTNLWTIGRRESLEKNLLDSWMSLNKKMRTQFGDFRKVIITKVNI